MKVVAFVPDLMDRSRFGSVAAQVSFVPSLDALAAAAREADRLVVDLGRPGALDRLGELPAAKVIAFASHVDKDLIAAAKAAGVQDVLPRSRFFSQIVNLLS